MMMDECIFVRQACWIRLEMGVSLPMNIHNIELHMIVIDSLLDLLQWPMNEVSVWWKLANLFFLWSQVAKFMGPTWGPPGSCRPQVGPMLTPWTLLSAIALLPDIWLGFCSVVPGHYTDISSVIVSEIICNVTVGLKACSV